MKKLSLLVALLMTFSFNSSAQAITIDFENYTEGQPIQAGESYIGTSSEVGSSLGSYNSFLWQNWGVLTPSVSPMGANYQAGLAPGHLENNNVAFNPFGNDVSISFGSTPIYLDRAYFTNALYPHNPDWAQNIITVTAFVAQPTNSQLVQNSNLGEGQRIVLRPTIEFSFTLNYGEGQWIEFDELDGIALSSIQFSQNKIAGEFGGYFGMDDFTYDTTPAPEPSSMALGLMSIAGLVARRRKQSL